MNQGLLFPPSLHDWLREAHLARFIVDGIEQLDLESIYPSYRPQRAVPSKNPALHFYGQFCYSYKSVSSRRRVSWEAS